MTLNERLRRSEATCEFLRNLANAMFIDMFERDKEQHGLLVEILRTQEVFKGLNNDSAIEISPLTDMSGFNEDDFNF